MRDVELYRQLLGLEPPWTVTRVELNVKDQRVDVWADHGPGSRWPCPECGQELAVYDHSQERSWRHLDSCQFMTYLNARPPRVRCPEHGVRQVRLPWAEPSARFTVLFERFAIDVLKETDVLGATRILRISWDEAWHLLEKAVERGQQAKGERVAARIGVDEKAAAKGMKYLLVYDIDRATVEYIADDRRQESLDGFFLGLSDKQLQGIEAVAMDMWPAYINSTLAHVPGAADKIVFDRFHIMKHMGVAVDTVRKKEHRELRAVGDDTLTGSKYVWLYAQENLPSRLRERFETLQAINLKTGRAFSSSSSRRRIDSRGASCQLTEASKAAGVRSAATRFSRPQSSDTWRT